MRLLIRRFLALCLLSFVFAFGCLALNQASISNMIAFSKGKGAMPQVDDGQAIPIVVSEKDFPGVIRIAKLFQDDICQVTAGKPELIIGELSKCELVIIAGTLGKNPAGADLCNKEGLPASPFTTEP
jgi:hypothetical protein